MAGDAERNAAAVAIAGIGIGFASPPPGAVVSGYYPVRGELDCLPLLETLVLQGYVVALPLTRDDDGLEFRTWRPGEPLQPGRFNIPCPVDGALVDPAVLLTPLLAFDGRGVRLGYGAGHYDRTLATLRSRLGAIAIGLAFDFQEAASLPDEAHDERLDWALTPSGPRRFGV